MNYFSSCQDSIIYSLICYKIKIHSFYEINFYIFYLKYAIAPTIDNLGNPWKQCRFSSRDLC